jgi:hypothetical protein
VRFKIDENLPVETAEILLSSEPLVGHLWIVESSRIRVRRGGESGER